MKSPTGQPELSAALDHVWNRFLPEIQERVAVLERAAKAFSADELTAELCEAASSAAHKLAGVLGTFGLARGTDLARLLEDHYCAIPAAASAPELTSFTAELGALITNRYQRS
jgi:HPt (histidine-containing phosphotransfer) domain-containing protein